MNKFLKLGGHKLVFGVMFVMFITVLPVSAQNVSAILNRIDVYRNSLDTLRTNISMKKYDPLLDETEEREGKLIYVAKTKKSAYMMRIDWTKPNIETLSVVNGKYVAYNQKANQAYTGTATSQQAVKKGGNALAFMKMSKAQLQANYNPPIYMGSETLSGSVNAWHLQLTPKTKSEYKSAEIWVTQDGLIIQIKMVPKSGDWSLFRLTNTEANPSLDTALFVVDLSGVKIISA